MTLSAIAQHLCNDAEIYQIPLHYPVFPDVISDQVFRSDFGTGAAIPLVGRSGGMWNAEPKLQSIRSERRNTIIPSEELELRRELLVQRQSLWMAFWTIVFLLAGFVLGWNSVAPEKFAPQWQGVSVESTRHERFASEGLGGESRSCGADGRVQIAFCRR